MKSYVSALVVMVTLLAGCGTQDKASQVQSISSSRRALSAELTHNTIDPKLNIGQNYGSSVSVDVENKMVTVFISNCPRNALCFWSGPSYSAELVDIKIESCGVISYKALTDARPVDGGLIDIVVTDNSKSLCDVAYPFLTEVVLKTAFVERSQGTDVTTSSIFNSKDALK